MYAPIDIGGSDFIETSFEDEHLVYADADDLTGSAGGDDDRSIDSQMRSQQEAQQEGKIEPSFFLFPIGWQKRLGSSLRKVGGCKLESFKRKNDSKEMPPSD